MNTYIVDIEYLTKQGNPSSAKKIIIGDPLTITNYIDNKYTRSPMISKLIRISLTQHKAIPGCYPLTQQKSGKFIFPKFI